jgi:hypothetical protein
VIGDGVVDVGFPTLSDNLARCLTAPSEEYRRFPTKTKWLLLGILTKGHIEIEIGVGQWLLLPRATWPGARNRRRNEAATRGTANGWCFK